MIFLKCIEFQILYFCIFVSLCSIFLLILNIYIPFPLVFFLREPGTNKENSIHTNKNQRDNMLKVVVFLTGNLDTKNNFRVVHFVWILTCCIKFQFESSACVLEIRLKMKQEVVC